MKPTKLESLALRATSRIQNFDDEGALVLLRALKKETKNVTDKIHYRNKRATGRRGR